MTTENKALSAVAQLADEESRNKSNRMIYYVVDSRYMEMIKKTLAPKELGHGFKLDFGKRGIE